ncbi:uncharacterized protein LOC114194959 isoform X1 [Vigna unguiculata]|uniref:uncharacterized protein LOC114194959 isoform X1 n=1 Tax=Vigna unguiculata TaxID=3917 RepID=UPI0010161D83|nr:uncharacterized protein LOC114194959 isoform X1 [Vigna unguiculata]
MAKSTLLHGRCCEGFVVLSRGRTWWLEGCRCVRDGLQIRGGFTPATFMVANGAHEYGLHWFCCGYGSAISRTSRGRTHYKCMVSAATVCGEGDGDFDLLSGEVIRGWTPLVERRRRWFKSRFRRGSRWLA